MIPCLVKQQPNKTDTHATFLQVFCNPRSPKALVAAGSAGSEKLRLRPERSGMVSLEQGVQILSAQRSGSIGFSWQGSVFCKGLEGFGAPALGKMNLLRALCLTYLTSLTTLWHDQTAQKYAPLPCLHSPRRASVKEELAQAAPPKLRKSTLRSPFLSIHLPVIFFKEKRTATLRPRSDHSSKLGRRRHLRRSRVKTKKGPRGIPLPRPGPVPAASARGFRRPARGLGRFRPGPWLFAGRKLLVADAQPA